MPAYEKFTEYTEVDPGSDITVNSDTFIDVATIIRDIESYLYYDKGPDYFGDFTHYVATNQYLIGTYQAQCSFWSLGYGNVYTQQDMINNGYGMYAQWNDGFAGRQQNLVIGDYVEGNHDQTDDLDVGTIYYCIIKRSGTIFTMEIYTDPIHTELIDVLSVTCGTTKYDYILAVSSRDRGSESDKFMSMYIYDMDLGECEKLTDISYDTYPLGKNDTFLYNLTYKNKGNEIRPKVMDM